MSIPFWRRPWLDGAKEHYEDDWSGYADDLDDEEPIAEECMDDDYDRALDELRGLYPQLDEHDRRFSDQYDTANGDIGDDALDSQPF